MVENNDYCVTMQDAQQLVLAGDVTAVGYLNRGKQPFPSNDVDDTSIIPPAAATGAGRSLSTDIYINAANKMQDELQLTLAGAVTAVYRLHHPPDVADIFHTGPQVAAAEAHGEHRMPFVPSNNVNNTHTRHVGFRS